MTSSLIELRLWRWQRYTAFLALPLVMLHIVLQYFVFGIDTTTFDAVSARARMAVFLGLDVLLLATVTAHAFLGLRSIFMDYAKNPIAAGRTSVLIAATFAGVILYGVAALAAFL